MLLVYFQVHGEGLAPPAQAEILALRAEANVILARIDAAERELNNPRVTPISPTAVGSGLLGIMKRTLHLPVKMIEPILINQTPVPPDKEQSQ